MLVPGVPNGDRPSRGLGVDIVHGVLDKEDSDQSNIEARSMPGIEKLRPAD